VEEGEDREVVLVLAPVVPEERHDVEDLALAVALPKQGAPHVELVVVHVVPLVEVEERRDELVLALAIAPVEVEGRESQIDVVGRADVASRTAAP
jgi:hypothetical protein